MDVPCTLERVHGGDSVNGEVRVCGSRGLTETKNRVSDAEQGSVGCE